MIVVHGRFGKSETQTEEMKDKQAMLDEVATSNWMFDRWSCTSGGVLTRLVDKLEKIAKDEKIIARKLTSKKKDYLKSLIKSCIHFEGKPINYTRGKQGKDAYMSSVELLHKLGLLEHNVANNEAVSSLYSFIYNYDKLLYLCSKVAAVKPINSTIQVKKPKDKNGNKEKIERAYIANPRKLHKLEKQMEDYNSLLDQYQINHPVLGTLEPMSYFRVFNGGSFGAELGGRYYSRHPAHNASNKKNSNGIKPRELISVTHTKTQEQYQLAQYDYTAQHLNFLYLHSTGKLFSYEWSNGDSQDPYKLYEDTTLLQRRLTKLINMASLGSQRPKSVVTKCLNKEQVDVVFDDELEHIEEVMPILDELGNNADVTIAKTITDYNNLHKDVLNQYKLGGDMPLALQYIDSHLATNIIKRLMDMNLPVWSWHDEFLIPCKDLTKDEAKKLLTDICNEELLNLRGSDVLNRLDRLRVNK